MEKHHNNIGLKLFRIAFLLTLFATIVRPMLVTLPPIFTIMGCVNCGICLCGYYVIKSQRFPNSDVLIFMTATFLILAPLIYISGGVNSQFAFLFPILPLVASELGSIRSSIKTTIALSLIIVILIIAEPYILDLSSHQYDPPKSVSKGLWLILSIIASSYFGVLSHNRKQAFTKELTNLAEQDPLTGVLNRRGLAKCLMLEFEKQQALSFLLLDIDHFKKINDEYGHDIGDTCLKLLVEHINTHTRQNDLICRMGGEEFLIILSNANLDQATAFGIKLCEQLREKHIPAIQRSLTVTIGVTTYLGNNDSLDAIVKRADQALYRGKNAGRDQLVVAEH